MSTTISLGARLVVEQVLLWLALGLTPGLGPTRSRRLLEHFGTGAAIFRASLSDLEARGLLAASAQSPGKPPELAQEELAKATAVGVQIVTLDDLADPPRPKQIYAPPRALCVRGDVNVLAQAGIAAVRWRHPTPLRVGHGRAAGDRLGVAQDRYRRASPRHRGEGEDSCGL